MPAIYSALPFFRPSNLPPPAHSRKSAVGQAPFAHRQRSGHPVQAAMRPAPTSVPGVGGTRSRWHPLRELGPLRVKAEREAEVRRVDGRRHLRGEFKHYGGPGMLRSALVAVLAALAAVAAAEERPLERHPPCDSSTVEEAQRMFPARVGAARFAGSTFPLSPRWEWPRAITSCLRLGLLFSCARSLEKALCHDAQE